MVGYGSSGQGKGKTREGYAYVVNDNVRVGQRLQVMATSHGVEKKKFFTTGVPLATYSENSQVGQIALQTETGGRSKDQLTNAYTGAQLGASGDTLKKNVRVGSLEPQTEYAMSARALTGEKALQADPSLKFTENALKTMNYYSESTAQKKRTSEFDKYSKPFMQ